MAASKGSKRKSALIVWGGWNGHTPEACAKLFQGWLKDKGWRVVVETSMDIYCNKRKMRNFDVVIPMVTMSEITGKQSAGLRDAVANGTGLAGFHGGMCDSFRNDVDYQYMTGGQWVQHPGGIIDYSVDLTSEDPIVRGLKPFSMHSEQYYMHTDPGNEVLATTTFSGKHQGMTWIKGTVMPVAWKRMWGKGRVFYSSLGHVADDFQVPEAFEIAKRGIQWAARERVKAEYKSA